MKGSFKGDIDIDVDMDMGIDIDVDMDTGIDILILKGSYKQRGHRYLGADIDVSMEGVLGSLSKNFLKGLLLRGYRYLGIDIDVDMDAGIDIDVDMDIGIDRDVDVDIDSYRPLLSVTIWPFL